MTAATCRACVEGTSALWVAVVGSSNCRLSRVLGLQRKLSARSDRVKCVDLHPKEPWMLASLYNGNVHVWNHETQVRGLVVDRRERGHPCDRLSVHRRWSSPLK